jgi:hypothetical protein
MMTYVDTRIGDGISYQKSGWSIVKQTKARFWWSDGYNRFDRFSVRADKKNNKTENDVAQELGVFRVYGANNLVLNIIL